MTVEAEKHSEFGGSSASRWINCPGSVLLARTVPHKAAGAAAQLGTDAHGLAQWCLEHNQRDVSKLNGHPVAVAPGVIVEHDEAMDSAVQVYVDAVFAELDAAPDAELFVEQSFDIKCDNAEPGEAFGRNDAMVYTPSRQRLVCFDYKHGAGVSVSAEDNAQAKFYTVGAVMSSPWQIGEIEIVIVQPRAWDVADKGAIRRWSMDPLEVFEFLAEINCAIGIAKGENAPLNSGDWCKFCPAAPACNRAEQDFFGAAKLDFAHVSDVTVKALPEVATLDVARIGATLLAAEALDGWLKKLREYAESLLGAGVPVPGWKLVDKVGRRKWIENGDEVATYLELFHGLEPSQIYPRKLATITEVERALAAKYPDREERAAAKDELSLRFTVKDSSGPTMVPASDKRNSVSAAASDFASVKV